VGQGPETVLESLLYLIEMISIRWRKAMIVVLYQKFLSSMLPHRSRQSTPTLFQPIRSVIVTRATMPLAGYGSRKSLPRTGNYDECSRSAGFGVPGAANELGYREAAYQFVFEYRVDKIAHLEFGRAASHVEFKLAARAVV
jgi:hypothetical protein